MVSLVLSFLIYKMGELTIRPLNHYVYLALGELWEPGSSAHCDGFNFSVEQYINFNKNDKKLFTPVGLEIPLF